MKWGEISADLDLTQAVNPQPESGALGVSPIKQETNCISISWLVDFSIFSRVFHDIAFNYTSIEKRCIKIYLLKQQNLT